MLQDVLPDHLCGRLIIGQFKVLICAGCQMPAQYDQTFTYHAFTLTSNEAETGEAEYEDIAV